MSTTVMLEWYPTTNDTAPSPTYKDVISINDIIESTSKAKKVECEFSAMETITGWLNGRKPWEKVFFRILKSKGVTKALVGLKKEDRKFYAVVKDDSLENKLELAGIYNSFLESYKKYKKDPYFEFLIFSEEEIAELNLENDLNFSILR